VALKITVRDASGVSVLSLEGRIGVGEEANALRDRVKALLGEGKTRLVLDLQHVALVDSAGLGTLVGLHQSAKSCGASLRLCNLSALVKELLQMTRLWTVFDVSATEAEAVQALSKSA